MKIFWIFAILWSLPWKGVALWKAAKNNQKGWYFAILVLQTLGILEILYIFKFQTDRTPKMNEIQEEKPRLPALFADFKEFLFKEYENIWALYRTNYEIRDRWVKFYFLVTASVLSFLGAFIKYFENSNPESNELSSTVAVIISLILFILFFLGFAVVLIEIVNRRARREMFNALNSIRKGFLSNMPVWKEFIYFQTEQKERAFGWRDFLATILPFSILVLINFWTLIWFMAENNVVEYVNSYFSKSPLNNIIIFGISVLALASIILYSLWFKKIKIKNSSCPR
jgi:hypothetical protein